MKARNAGILSAAWLMLVLLRGQAAQPQGTAHIAGDLDQPSPEAEFHPEHETEWRDASGKTPSSGHRPGLWHRLKVYLQGTWWGYPEEFHELPLGALLHAHGRVQVEKGLAAQMVFYRYDFLENRAGLNARGRRRASHIAEFLPRTFFPVLIEPVPGASRLNEARRQSVLQALADAPIPIPPERVRIARPPVKGLSGTEAEAIYQNLKRQTATQGGREDAGFGRGFGPGAAFETER